MSTQQKTKLAIKNLLSAERADIKAVLALVTKESNKTAANTRLSTITKENTDRKSADAVDKQEYDSLTALVSKVKALSEQAELQRIRRDINIVRMTTQQRILSGLSTMNKHIEDLDAALK